MPMMGGTPVYSLHYLLNRVKTRFGRTVTEVEEHFLLDINSHIREICCEFPYWFLRFDPGTHMPERFLSTTGDVSDATLAGMARHDTWVDQGWFYTEEDREVYPVFVPATFMDGDQVFWAPAELSQLLYVVQYTAGGIPVRNLDVLGGEQYTSRANYSGSGGTLVVMPQTRGQQTFLRLSQPADSTTYLMAVGGQLAYPPWYSSGGSMTNVLLQTYPQVMYHVGCMVYAEYFGDMEKYKFHHSILWGDAGGKVRSEIPNVGLVGKMKIDTWKREEQATPDLPFHASSRAALGRTGYTTRSPSAAYYVNPGDL